MTNNCNSKYKNFYVLGDSLSDNGAIIGILKNLLFLKHVEFDLPFYQRRSFSNGPMAVEYLAEYLGIKEFKPGWKFSIFGKEYTQKGQNYAVSYATAAKCSNFIYSVFFNKFRLAKQLTALTEHNLNIGQEDLFLIMIGGNDVMFAATCNSGKAENILEQAVDEICSVLENLSKRGVQHVIVTNIANVGLIPAFNKNKEAKELATKLTESFNAKLFNGLKNIKKKYINLEIKQLDLASEVKGIVDKYKNHGLNYQDACISNFANTANGFKGTTKMLFQLFYLRKFAAHYNPGCSEETLNDYLFFDYFHPTTKTHQEIANKLYELIAI